MITFNLDERRVPAPHPGPLIRRQYFESIGLSISVFADHVGINFDRLDAMLHGEAPIDALTAVYFGRVLQLPAERIMQMQLKYDFATARSVNLPDETSHINIPKFDFPENDYLVGNIFMDSDNTMGFREKLINNAQVGQGVYKLWRGDMLCICSHNEPDSEILWSGKIIQNLDGHLMIALIESHVWKEWFARNFEARFALGQDHLSNLKRAH